MKTKKAIIFGTGTFAQLVSFLLTVDSEYEVVAFTASKESITQEFFLDKPLVPFENIEKYYSSEKVSMFIAIGYTHMNKLREKFMLEATNKNYNLLSYVSSKAQHWGDTLIGKNVFIFENNNIQPYVSIGDGAILWSGNHIGHHSMIGKYCFIASHAVISGYCRVGDRTFIGVNSTITDGVDIADGNLIGAGALIAKNTKPNEVYAGDRTKAINKSSEMFFK